MKKNKYMKNGIHTNTSKLLFEENVESSDKRYSSKNSKVLNKLELFTLSGKSRYVLSRFKYDKDNNRYKYVDTDSEYSFDLISNRIDNNNLKEELISYDRYGKCHMRSIMLAADMIDSKVLTGYINVDDRKVIHSVVEYTASNGEERILDWTRNLEMSKKDYIDLTKFQQISSVGSSQIKKDFITNGDITTSIPVDDRTYLLFRDEFIKDFYNNPIVKKKIK